MSAGAAARRPLASRLADRWAARAAGRRPAGDGPGTGSGSEPRSTGDPLCGRALLAGRIRLAGHAVEAAGKTPWDVAAPDAAFAAEAQGFAWLDDLAALGTAPARRLAQEWVARWVARYGQGRGPGWHPALAGRRVIRLLHHADFLMDGRPDPAGSAALDAALLRMGDFLARRAASAEPGLPRFEALTGRLYAALALAGLADDAGPATAALAGEAAARIGADGGIASRNPEELAGILTHLDWAARALAAADRAVPAGIGEAIDRIAPCLRCLRHADGGLPRFHGGDRGAEGMLERALAASALRPAPGHACRAMGYLRLSGGRTTVVLDAASPPGGAREGAAGSAKEGAAGGEAHASTGAFELTSGRRPVVISCGPGRHFDHEWQLAARATQSHSALCIDGLSSSRLSLRRGSEALGDFARVTRLQQAAGDGALVQMTHDGWAATHGLSATRELHLSADGRRLGGTDTLAPPAGPRREAGPAPPPQDGQAAGTAFSIRFHLHPEVEAMLDPSGALVHLVLRSGEVWVFRHDGRAHLSLAPSFYLRAGADTPLGCRQIVLSARAGGGETRIGWTLAKSRDTPLAIRDLARDDADADDP